MSEELANQSQETTQETTATATEQTTQGTETTQTQEPFLSIKYNKDEVPLTKEEAVELAQKGKNYEKVKGKADTYESALSRAARLTGYGSVDEYLRAIDEAERQAETKRYEDAGITDPKLIEEIIDRHPVVQKAKQVTLQTEKDSLKDKPFFNELSPEIDRMMAANPKIDTQTAYAFLLGQKVLNGGMDTLTADLKDRIAKLEQGIGVKNANADNAAKSTGSATGQGEIIDGFISKETFEQNKSNQRWVIKNLPKIQESRPKW